MPNDHLLPTIERSLLRHEGAGRQEELRLHRLRGGVYSKYEKKDQLLPLTSHVQALSHQRSVHATRSAEHRGSLQLLDHAGQPKTNAR